MRTPLRAAVTATALAALAVTGLQAPAAAAPVARDAATAPSSTAAASRPDDRPGPRTREQRELRAAAIEKVAKGQAVKDAKGVVKLGNGKFAEVETTKSDKIFTVLSEFGTAADRKLGTAPGPQHDQIPAPDRSKDNSTYWEPTFNKAHYEELFNGPTNSMKDYYEKLSSGRYSVTNTVEDWVTVPGNASTYGDNAVEDTGGSWAFVQDTGDAWYAAQIAAGTTADNIDAHLAQFDVWDRYDFDGDGNFDEADGYIDHFQAVHAGAGEEAGADPDAIWSHRWYVNGTDYGQTGPKVGAVANKSGGAQIGASSYWFGDYTTEPENGGLGVFAHEFGHDLGLPDYYDTSGGENSTAFWTLMSSGSWLNRGENDIGTTPGLMGPEEKLYLGWLDHSTVAPGRNGSYVLNPSQTQVSGKDQAVRVDLPDKTTSTKYTTPPSGAHAWWTGSADGLNESLSRPVAAAANVIVTAKAWYEIEADYDYLYGEYSTDGGVNWTQVGAPVDGSSGGAFIPLSWSYSPAGGAASLFRFRYQTDGGVHEAGAFLDDIVVNGVTDTVEAGAGSWTATGLWQISTGTDTRTTEQYYLVENRGYVGYDATLEVGPYQFSEGLTRPDWVERFAFQNGMLVWYVDDAFADNNVGTHPGGGAAMVVDARPKPFSFPDGTRPSNRRQPLDATFGLTAWDKTCLHKQVAGKRKTVAVQEACAPGGAGIPTFDDSDPARYWSSENPQGSVKVAGHGVKVTVTGDAGDDLSVSVSNPR